uniref:Uncharacterized protein n=1 Tax=Strigamia maritima TaxID=126957 RepID=T1ISY0_STRMM
MPFCGCAVSIACSPQDPRASRSGCIWTFLNCAAGECDALGRMWCVWLLLDVLVVENDGGLDNIDNVSNILFSISIASHFTILPVLTIYWSSSVVHCIIVVNEYSCLHKYTETQTTNVSLTFTVRINVK